MIDSRVYSWKKLNINKRFTIIFMIIALYLTKPMVTGANLTPVAMIIMLFLALISIGKRNGKLSINRKSKHIMFAILLYYLYAITQSTILLGNIDMSVFKAMLSILVIVLCYSILFNDKIIEYYFFRIYIITLIFFVASYFITVFFSFFISIWDLHFHRTVVARYGYHIDIYFPLTVGLGTLEVAGFRLVRLTALLRESGIAQAFYLWAFVAAEQYFTRKNLVKILMFAGLIFSLSTAGYINALVVLGLIALFNLKGKNKLYAFTIILVLIVIYYGFNNIQGIRFEDKNAISYDARVSMLEIGIKEFFKKPIFGSGYSDIYIPGTATSFLQRAYTIGFVGVALFLNIILQGFIHEKNKKRYILAYAAILSTTLLSQPIENAPLIFLFLIPNYGDQLIPQKINEMRRSL